MLCLTKLAEDCQARDPCVPPAACSLGPSYLVSLSVTNKMVSLSVINKPTLQTWGIWIHFIIYWDFPLR